MLVSHASLAATTALAFGLSLAAPTALSQEAGTGEPTVFRSLARGDEFPSLELRDLSGTQSPFEPTTDSHQVVAFLRLDQEGSRLLFEDLVELAADPEGPQPLVSIVDTRQGDWESRAKGLPSRLTVRVADGAVAERLGLIVLPSVALIDPNGQLARAYVLYDPELTKRIRSDLEALAGDGQELPDEELLRKRHFDELERNAAALEGIGQLDEALILRHQQLSLGIHPQRVLARIGKTHFLLGEWDDATDFLGRSLELEETPSAKTWLGRSLARVGRHDEAREILQDVLPLTPQKAIVHRELAAIHRQRGDVTLALEHIRQALDLVRPPSRSAGP